MIFIPLRSHYHASTSTPSIGFISLVLGSWKEGNKPKFHPWIHNKWNLPPNWFCILVIIKISSPGFQRVSKLYAKMRFQTPRPLLISWIEIWSFASRTFLPNIPEQRNFIICTKFLQKFSCEIILSDKWICLDKFKILTIPIG